MIRPAGTPVRITLISADRAAVEAAITTLQQTGLDIRVTSVQKTQSGTWAAMGTMFVEKENER